MSKTTKFKLIKHEISSQLYQVNYEGDLSDLGNEIGMVLGKHIKKDKMEYELESFIQGLKHGISLSGGTHPKIKD
jgi:hypothetical protein